MSIKNEPYAEIPAAFGALQARPEGPDHIRLTVVEAFEPTLGREPVLASVVVDGSKLATLLREVGELRGE